MTPWRVKEGYSGSEVETERPATSSALIVPHVGLVEKPGSSGVEERGGAEKSRRWMISRTSSRGRDIV